MKIVINGCYGGFSLSPLAVKELAKRKGRECYFFKYDFTTKKHTPITLEQATAERFVWTAFSVPNPDEQGASQENWHEMTPKQREASSKAYRAIDIPTRPEDRTDPDLVAVVKKLGKKADGMCAQLRIVEIPDGVEWELDEYDGIEHVAEKHRTWA